MISSALLLEHSDSDDGHDDSEDDDSDDEDGWITPNNIQDIKSSMGDVNIERAIVPVACLTTDFAIQVHFGGCSSF